MLAFQDQNNNNNSSRPTSNNTNGRSSKFHNRNRNSNADANAISSNTNNFQNGGQKKNMFQRSNPQNFNRSQKPKDSAPTFPKSTPTPIPSSNNAPSSNTSQFQEEIQFDSLIGGFPINHALFQNVNSVPRQLPKFLVYQPPNIKAAPLVQDEWDRANQQKMAQIEAETKDLSFLYDDFSQLREKERAVMEQKGLVDKEDTRKTLEDAIAFQGSCYDMCPVFERIRRSVENDVTRYEKDEMTGKIMKSRAIKAFSRPAAGQPPPLPSDVRPPQILIKTLDYIIDNLLDRLPEAQAFIWDRTRSIRQDFTYQNYIGPEAIDCNERIVRIHILTLHIMAKSDAEYSQQQELEQMNKAFKTLSEMYNEFRSRGLSAPNEAEFKSYYMLSQLRDPELDREIQALPIHLLKDPNVQLALNLRNLVQTNIVERSFSNLENTLNFYKNFFQNLNERKLPALFSFLLEIHLNEIRFYAVKSIKKSLAKNAKPYPMSYLVSLLAFNDESDLRQFAEYYGIACDHQSIDLKTLNHNSHLITDQKPLKQAFLLKYDTMFGSYQNLINSGKSNLDIDVGDIPEFKSTLPPRQSTAIPTTTPFALTSSASSTSPPAFSFGSKTKPAFGSSTTSAFGTMPAFGASSPAKFAFSQPTSTTSTSGQAPTPSAFGQTPTTSAFEKPDNAPSFSFASHAAKPATESATQNPAPFSLGAKPTTEKPAIDNEKLAKEEALKNEKLKEERIKLEREAKLEQQRKEEELKKQQEVAKIQEMKQKLLMEKQRRKDKIDRISKDLSLSIYNSMVQAVAGKESHNILAPIYAKKQYKTNLIAAYGDGLLEAFVNELVYVNTLEVLADRFRHKQQKKFIVQKIKTIADNLIKQQEIKKRKRDEFLQVSKSFGIPSSLVKRKRARNGPSDQGTVAKVDLHSFKLEHLMGKLEKYETYSLLVFNTNELNSTISRLLKLKLPKIIKNNGVELNIPVINKKIDDLNLLVNNQFVLINIENFGTTDEFNLNYLIQGLKLNSNYKVEILIVIWDIKDLSNELTIRNTIMKIFRNYMADLIISFKIIKINSNLELGLIEEELDHFGNKVILTRKGEFNVSNKFETSTLPSPKAKSSRSINHPNILESSKKHKTKIQHNERIFNHYKTHLEASPRYRHKKLPTLRSNIYKDTPTPPSVSGQSFKQHIQNQLKIDESLITTDPSLQPNQTTTAATITKKKTELYNTPRPKSSQLLETPSFFNDSCATMSTFSNVTFDAAHQEGTPLIRKKDAGDVRMRDADESQVENEPPIVDSNEYSRNLMELKELTKLVKKTHAKKS